MRGVKPMINVTPINDSAALSYFCAENGIEVMKNRGVTVAKDGEEILGFCAYILTDDSITVTHLSTEEDIMLADGILRSALHIADFRGITNAFYTDSAPVKLFSLLGFIKSDEEKALKIEKLHESCCSCGK